MRGTQIQHGHLLAPIASLLVALSLTSSVAAQQFPGFEDKPPAQNFPDQPIDPAFGGGQTNTTDDFPDFDELPPLENDSTPVSPAARRPSPAQRPRPTYPGITDRKPNSAPAARGKNGGFEDFQQSPFDDAGAPANARQPTQGQNWNNGRAGSTAMPGMAGSAATSTRVKPASNIRRVSQTKEPAQLRLTKSDVDRNMAAAVDHRSTQITNPQLLSDFHRHVMAIPYGQQKRDAHAFMRIRRRLLEQRDPIAAYQLRPDIDASPLEYCGRPVLIHGIAGPLQRVQGGSGRFETTVFDPKTRAPLAIIDVGMADDGNINSGEAGVLVTGFFYKSISAQVGNQQSMIPLVIAQRVEWLGAQIPPPVLSTVTHQSRGIPEQEADAFYETLRHVQLLDYKSQAELAVENRRQRIDGWLKSEKQVVQQMAYDAEIYRESDPAKFESLMEDAEIYHRDRIKKHADWLAAPETFPIFVDVFQNEDIWHGQLVTMTGHVRNVRSYPANDDYLELGLLHELWLYTDDSQKNPAVIICSELPKGFPSSIDEEVVDGVTVTGFFFKKYRYAAQDATRLAPMLIAQRIDWDPTAMATEVVVPGWLTTLFLVGLLIFGAALVMYLVGLHDQDRRFRKRLRAGDLRQEPFKLHLPTELTEDETTTQRFSTVTADADDEPDEQHEVDADLEQRLLPPMQPRVVLPPTTEPQRVDQPRPALPRVVAPEVRDPEPEKPPVEPEASIAAPTYQRKKRRQREVSVATRAESQQATPVVERTRARRVAAEPVISETTDKAVESVSIRENAVESDETTAITQTTTEPVEPTEFTPVQSANVLGQTVRAVLRAAPSTEVRTESGKSPLVVVLRNGIRFELLEDSIVNARTAAEIGELRHAREKGQKIAGSTISDVVLDQWGNLYLVMNGDRYLSMQDMSANAARVSSSKLRELLERSDEIEFTDFWTGESVERSVLTRNVKTDRKRHRA